MPRGQSDMCIVNAALVPHIAKLAGPQTQVMHRLGISWNSWIKVSAGLPIRVSVGVRLRNKVLSKASSIPEIYTVAPGLLFRDKCLEKIDGFFLIHAEMDYATRLMAARLRSLAKARSVRPFLSEQHRLAG